MQRITAKMLGIVLALVFLNSAITAETTGDRPVWKPLSEKEMKTRLKAYAYAKIRSTLRAKYKFESEKETPYQSCPEEFPELPGSFPCSFLNWEEDSSINKEDLEFSAGGIVSVWQSQTKSPLLLGRVVLLGGNAQTKNQKVSTTKDDMILFYNPNQTVSHYRVGDQAVLFRWKTEGGSDTLKSLLWIELDRDHWAKSAREMDYSK